MKTRLHVSSIAALFTAIMVILITTPLRLAGAVSNCTTTGGPGLGAGCIFPFTWEGISHSACTIHGNKKPDEKPWCATELDEEDAMNIWADCGPECPIEDGCRAIDGRKCVFPFEFRGLAHDACTVHGNKNAKERRWCATKVDDAGVMEIWSECGRQCPTEEGCWATNGKKCILPYTFGGITHDVCTIHASPDQENYICSTKVDSDGEHIVGNDTWGYCGEGCPIEEGCWATNGRQCLFPFKVLSGTRLQQLYTTHYACTVHGNKGSQKERWCATQVDNYGISNTLNVCGPECPVEKGCWATNGEKCNFPFEFNYLGTLRTYNECTWDYAFHDWGKKGLRDGRAWCGTQQTSKYSDHWGDCADGCPIPGRKHPIH